MCAGTGVRHSEFNPNPNTLVHLLQIWIIPDRENHTPSYGQKNFETELATQNNLVLVVSQDGRAGSIPVHQSIDLYATKSLTTGENKFISNFKHQWLQVISGKVKVNSQELGPGDGAAMTALSELNLLWDANSEFLLFDMI
jgi:redox-sensitive bicupin YhaK (pirin superfamily)